MSVLDIWSKVISIVAIVASAVIITAYAAGGENALGRPWGGLAIGGVTVLILSAVVMYAQARNERGQRRLAADQQQLVALVEEKIAAAYIDGLAAQPDGRVTPLRRGPTGTDR